MGSRALVIAAALVAACSQGVPPGRPCDAQGKCLTGFRCRAQICVPLTAEVCNGEDDDDNGFIDEHGDRAFPRVVLDSSQVGVGPLVARTPDQAVLLFGSQEFTEADGPVFRYTLFDAQWRPLGPARVKLLLAVGEGIFSSAIAANDTGFLLGFVIQLSSSAEVRTLEIARDGTPGEGTPVAPLPGRAAGVSVEAITLAGTPRVAWIVEGTLNLAAAGQSPAGIALPGLTGSAPFSLAADGDRLAVGSTGGVWIVQGGEVRGSSPIPGAASVQVAWLDGEVLAIWLDTSVPEQSVVRLARFDAEGNALPGTPLSVAAATAGAAPALLVPGSHEVLVAWYELGRIRFRRVSPSVGAYPRLLAFEGGAERMLARQLGGGYEVLVATTKAPLHEVALRCSDEPEPDAGVEDAGPPDAGADGGVDGGADGGVDGGADAGPPGLPACPTEAPPGVLVQGRVRWWDGAPMSGATVVLGTCQTTSAADGTFSGAIAGPPYDLSVVWASGGGHIVVSYLDVSSASLDLVHPLSSGDPHATFSGTYQGDAGVAAKLHLLTPAGGDSSSLGAGSFSLPISWLGGATTATAALLEHDPQGRFVGAALFPNLALEPDGAIVLGPIATAPIGSQTVAAHLPGGVRATLFGMISLNGGWTAANRGDADGTTLFGLELPVLEGADAFVFAALTYADESKAAVSSPLLTPDGGADLDPAVAAPALQSPADNATAVGASPTFELSAVAGASYHAVLAGSQSMLSLVFGPAPPLRRPASLEDLGLGFTEPTQWLAAGFLGSACPSYEEIFAGADLGIYFLGGDIVTARPGRIVRISGTGTFTP